ncbi:MAG TPA: ABC transporter ATP-binding protein [Thermoplasmataceae archaeon]|nr:ABC transporter ATP-binding protein [Thermoplasmatales archaeon AK]HLH85530.1 ABC transporter ATP-binding protein [Thermoplasmataceae archaeon]
MDSFNSPATYNPYNCIVASNIVKAFGRVRALNGLNISVPCGRRVALLGPNGAGKSTALKILAGLLLPDSGEVLLKGNSPNSMQAKEILGYLPEDAVPYISLSVRENLEYVAAIRGIQESQARIDQIIDLLNLQEYEDMKITKVSRGTRQKVSVAISIIHNPEVVLMDEPLNYLDIPSQENMIKLLSSMNATFLISTHILSIAERLTDDVIIISHGQEIWKGRRNDLQKLGNTENEPVESIVARLMENAR